MPLELVVLCRVFCCCFRNLGLDRVTGTVRSRCIPLDTFRIDRSTDMIYVYV